ncbi:acyl-CoA thioesterase II [Cladophialophora immunda]|uniref:Acyl-CoA thioesterase II n=1 Tax=Cladophialophora immunda TaxID=569365 RepID=A0A0D1ZT03_9EURO|nr:acyl-CoA thioesterase II [Cladophialophora immunda]KIW31226.1 acyl-CoA thioesterase II [Cladophialophora immunda]
MATTLAEQIGVEETGPDEFISLFPPARGGNQLPIAYGGCTIGVGVHAAFRTVKPGYNLYSVLGHFLGPSRTDQRLTCRVQRLRDTRTFATRRVEISQSLPNGEQRLCMTLQADFHVSEPAMMEYSAPPETRYSDVSQCPSVDKIAEELVSKGYITEEAARSYRTATSILLTFFENRFCPEGIWGQTLGGLAKQIRTTQDHLPITSKTSGDWFRATQPLSSTAEHLAALAFMMDAGPSFMPLIHNNKGMHDAGAASTLDFALRIFVNDVDTTRWHLRERMTRTAGVGRNYAESRLWDQNGRMVASMTQQCILRPKPNPSASL